MKLFNSQAPTLSQPVFRSPEKGISLISVLVGVVITGILVVVVNNFGTTTMRAVQSVNRIGELEDIRRLLRARLHCSNTLSHMTNAQKQGTSNTLIVLYGKNDQPVLAVDSEQQMTISNWTVSAADYDPANGAFTISASKSGYVKDDLFNIAAPLVCPLP